MSASRLQATPTPAPWPPGNTRLSRCGGWSAGGATGIQWVETRDAAEYQNCGPALPATRGDPAPNGKSAEVETVCSDLLFMEQILSLIQRCE